MFVRRRWRPSTIGVVTGLAAAALVVGGSAVAAHHEASTSTSSPDSGPAVRAPSYALTDQNGRQVSSTAFRGKVQVVSFLFPFCTSYCPVTARAMTQLQQHLASTPLHGKVQIVAFNVDPAGASPARMREFWTEFGGDPTDPSASFLTGTPSQIRHVVTDGFHVYYRKVTDRQQQAEMARAKTEGTYVPEPQVANRTAARAKVDYDVVHNDVMEIIGPRGRILRVFDDASQVPVTELDAAVAAAAKGSDVR